VISILHVDLKIPGGTYKQDPLFRTTTFVGYVPSNPSSALKQANFVVISRECLVCRHVNAPIVHQDIGLPYSMRRYPKIFDATVLGRVPTQIHVVPFLREEPRKQIEFHILIKN
jgi:hypothetical protein